MHNAYLTNMLLFLLFRRKKKKEFPGLPNYSPDWKVLKGLGSHEVKMGTHGFICFSEIRNRKPEDLTEYVQSQTKHLPTLEDVVINGCLGKTYGDCSEQMTWIDWWIKGGDCMICFNLQGIRMPPQAIKDDVSDILNNLEYIGD